MLSALLVREEGQDMRDRGPWILGIACGFLGASMVVGLVRLALRTKRRLFSWDDGCIVVGLLFSALQTISACMTVRWGYGKPIQTLTPHELSKAIFWFYIAQVAYKGSIWPAKISILLLYNRVFGDTTQQVTSFGLRLRTSLVFLITFAALFWFTSEIVTVFTCVPVQRYWDKSVPGKCQVNTLAWWFTQSILNTVSDIFILVLPMPLIRHLQIPKQQKLSLMLVFALGIFVTVCTIVRMTTFKTGAKGADATYDGAVTLVWSLIETNIAIICACLPLLRPLIARIIPSFGRSKSRSKDRPSGYKLRDRYGRRKSNPPNDAQHGDGDGIAAKNDDVDGNQDSGSGVSRRKESWDWKDQTTITATTVADYKFDSDDNRFDFHAGASSPGLPAHDMHNGYRSNFRPSDKAAGRDHYGNGESSRDICPFGFGGITKQTDVDITTETASEHGSQKRLTAIEHMGAGGYTADIERGTYHTRSL